MNDQYIQLIEDYLAKGVAHPDIIENLGNDVSDDAAKFAADYLKKKDQPEQGGGSESTLDPSLSESAGADQMLDPFGRPITVGLKGVDIVAEKQKFSKLLSFSSENLPTPKLNVVDGKIDYGLKTQEDVDDMYARWDEYTALVDNPDTTPDELVEFFVNDERNMQLFPEKYEEVKNYYKSIEDFNKSLQEARTMDDLEAAFSNFGLEGADLESALKNYKDRNGYAFSMLNAEQEWRETYGFPTTGEVNYSAIAKETDRRLNEISIKRSRLEDLNNKFKNNSEELLRLQTAPTNSMDGAEYRAYMNELNNLTSWLSSADEEDLILRSEKAHERIVQASSDQNSRLRDWYKETLSSESFDVYEAYVNKYSESLLKNLIEDAKRIGVPNYELEQALVDYQYGKIDYDGFREFVRERENIKAGAASTVRGPEQAEIMAAQAAGEVFKAFLGDADQMKASYLANTMERELRQNKLLAIDLDGDKRIAPMGFADSLLGEFQTRYSGGMPLSYYMNRAFGEENVEQVWDKYFQPWYEPIERVGVNTANALMHVGSGVFNFADWLGNTTHIYDIIGEGAMGEETAQMLKRMKESYDMGTTTHLRQADGDKTWGGEFADASDNFAYTAISLIGSKHPIGTGLLLFTGMANQRYTDLMDEDFYAKMTPLARFGAIIPNAGFESLTEVLTNKTQLKLAKYGITGGLRGGYRDFVQYSAAQAGVFGLGVGVETGGELLNHVLSTGMDHLVLTPYGVKAGPIMTTQIAEDIFWQSFIIGGSVQTGASVHNQVKKNREINEINSQISKAVNEMMETGNWDVNKIKQVMALNDKASMKFVDQTAYLGYLADKNPRAFRALEAANAKLDALVEEAKSPETSKERQAEIQAELAAAAYEVYEADFVGLHGFITSEAHLEGKPVFWTERRIEHAKGEIQDLKAEKVRLEQAKKHGRDVGADLALVNNKIEALNQYVGALETHLEKAKTGEVKEKSASLKYLSSLSAKEAAERLANSIGAELTDAELDKVGSFAYTNDTAFLLDENGRIFKTIKHSDKTAENQPIPISAVVNQNNKDQIEALRGLGFVPVAKDEESGTIGFVLDKNGDGASVFGDISETFKDEDGNAVEKTFDEKIREAEMRASILGKARGAAHKRMKVETLADYVSRGGDISALGGDLAEFAEQNKNDITSFAELLRQNREARAGMTEQKYGAAGLPSNTASVSNPITQKVVDIARAAGLEVLVGDDAQMARADGKTLKEFQDGAVVAGFARDGKIYLNQNATAKDAVEEVAHAKLLGNIMSNKARRQRFQNDLQSILISDPWMAFQLQDKEQRYRADLSKTNKTKEEIDKIVEEEMLAEAISIYVANSGALEASTIDKLKAYITDTIGLTKGTEIDFTRDNLDAVMDKLNQSLKKGRMFTVSQEQINEDNAMGTAMESKYRGANSWLHKKPVSIVVWKKTYDGGPIKVASATEKTFEDYGRFRSWYNKMSGNGNLSSMVHVDMKWWDEKTQTWKNLNPPKPFTDKEGVQQKKDPVAAWMWWGQRQMYEREQGMKEWDRRTEELTEIRDMLIASGMDRYAAQDLMGWDGYGRGWAMQAPTLTQIEEARQAAGDWLAEQEMTSPESQVMYASYGSIVDKLNTVLRERPIRYDNDGTPIKVVNEINISNVRDNAEYRAQVVEALSSIAGSEKDLQAFVEAITGSTSKLSDAELQAFFVSVNKRLLGNAARNGTSKLHQQRVVDALEAPLRRLMNTDRGMDFVNFFSDFRAALPEWFEKVADDNHLLPGTDQDMAILQEMNEAQDLFLSFVAVLSNGNEAVPNIVDASYAFAAYMSGDRARWELALQQITEVAEYRGIQGRPDRSVQHGRALAETVDLWEKSDDFRGELLQVYEGGAAPKARSVERQKEAAVMRGLIFGSKGKIGAFWANLLGDESYLAQDSHFTREMHRARGITPNYNTAKEKEVIEKTKAAAQQLKDLGYQIPSGKMTSDAMIALGREIHAKFKGGTAAAKERKLSMTPIEKDIFSWYDNSVARQLPTAPKDMQERHLNYTIAKELANRLGISVAALQQLMFYDNHLLQQTFGRGAASEDLTFTDILNQGHNTNLENAVPTDLASERIKANDARLRQEISTRDLAGSAPMPTDSHKVSDLVGNEQSQIELAPLFDGSRKIAPSNTPQRITPARGSLREGGGWFLRGESGMGKASVVVLSRADLSNAGPDGTIEGEVTDSRVGLKESADLDIVEALELDLINGKYYSGNHHVIGADNVTMVGPLVFASGEIRYGDDVAWARAEDMTEDQERYAGDQAFNAEVEAIMSTEGLSREDAEIFALDTRMTPMYSKLRGTAERVSNSKLFNDELREGILKNPDNYFDRSSLTDMKTAMDHMTTPELLAYMRSDKLGELKTDENYGPLATITLINRYHEAGNNEAASALITDLAATGTNLGRLLRQFAELKTSSPESMASTIVNMAERNGKKLPELSKKQINEQSRIVFEMYKKAQDLFAKGQQGEDVWDEYQKALKDLATAEKELDILANKNIERTWGELIRTTIQGNLLTPMSQATNVVANLSNFIPKTMVDISAYPMEKMLAKSFPMWYGQKAGLNRQRSFSSYLYGVKRFGAGFMESLDEIATGKRSQDLTEWRVGRSLMPVHSLMAFASSDLPIAKSIVGDFNQRAKLLFQGTFGAPAESMFRLLGLGDTPFRRYAEGLELMEIGKARGLEGKELDQFVKFPPSDVMEQARQRGLEFTFQNNTAASQMAEFTISSLARGFGNPFKNVPGFDGEDFFNTIIRMNVPYVRTPANLLEETLTYASPAIAMARAGKHLVEGNPRAASENFAKGMIGQTVTMSSFYLIANGLVSGPADDDNAVRNLQYDTFPPNCINVSGLKRLLAGEDPAYQAGDEFRNYQKLGLFGSIMGAAASSTSKQAAEEIIKNPFSGTEIFKRTFGFDNVATLSYMMDQSFLQGLNSSLQVLSISNPEEAERAWSQWVEGMFRSGSAVVMPNTLSAINRAQREYMPDMRSSSMAERLENTVRDRLFMTSELPVRYNWKGEPIKQTPDGAGSIAYQFFDVTKTREGSSDPVSMEALRIYQETGQTIKPLDVPYFASSVFRHIDTPSFSRGKAKKAYAAGKKYEFVEAGVDFKMKLNAEQVNEALRLAASLRFQECTQFVQSDRYKNMTDEERLAEFESLNSKYNGLVEFDPDGNFMPHTIYLMDLFEEEYKRRLKDGEFETD